MRKKPDPVAEQVIESFGGLSATAKALAHKHVTTVQGWKTSGIPKWRRPEIIEAAQRVKVILPQAFTGDAA